METEENANELEYGTYGADINTKKAARAVDPNYAKIKEQRLYSDSLFLLPIEEPDVLNDNSKLHICMPYIILKYN